MYTTESNPTPSSAHIDFIPDDILAEIGKIVAWWGYIEFQLGVIAREIACLPKNTGRVFTIGPDIGALCSMLQTLVLDDTWIDDKTIRDDISAFAKKVREKSKIRHSYAHGVFTYDEDKKAYVRLLVKSAPNRVNPETEILEVGHLSTFVREARELWNEAQRITRTLKAWNNIHSSPSY